MVRGPAALLAAYALALAYFLAAPGLPALPAGDTAIVVGDGVGLLVLGACALGVVGAREQPWSLVLLGAGAGLVAITLHSAGVGPGANVFEALLGAAVGMLFARAFAAPAALVALPILVAGIDTWSVLSGPSSTLIRERPHGLDFLTFQLPGWGGGAGGELGLSDIVFLATFAAWTWRFGLRRRITAGALVGALVAALVLNLELGRALPVLPLLAVAFLAPNLDRIVALLSRDSGLTP